MKAFHVTFYDKGNCDIVDITVWCANVVFAVSRARIQLLVSKGYKFCAKLDREVDSVLIEELT